MANNKQLALRGRSRKTDKASRAANVASSLSSLQSYRIRRTVAQTVSQGSVDVGRSFVGQLSQLPNISEFTSLFDQYRILKIHFSFLLLRAGQFGTTGVYNYPNMCWSYDPNDSTTPVTLADVTSYQQFGMEQFSETKRRIDITIVPRVPVSTPSTTLALPGATWCSTSDTSQPWFGLKTWIQEYASTLTTGTVVQVFATYDMEFRNPR